MDFDKKDGYLDGVSLKISSAFLPPPPVVLPPHTTTEELNLEKYQYDFSLEKKALDTICKMKEKKKKAESQQPENTCNKNPTNIQTLFSSDILLPKTQKDPDRVLSNSEGENGAKRINLSDFENDMSSPFDYMELQTINDLEELSNVFQGLNPSFEGEKNADSTHQNHSVTKSMSFPRSSFDSPEMGAVAEEETSKDLNCFSDLNDSQAFSASTVLPKVPFIACPRNNVASDKPSLRVCKSYSDIHHLTSDHPLDTMMPGRSATPPTLVHTTTTPKNTLSVQEEGKEIADCDNSPPAAAVGLPDPYEELPEEDRRFVDAITDMGFPRAQVSRTVRHLGRDEKVVVEHLCQIQNLEECGYDCLEAEAALHLHDYKQDQAKKFLDLINKFQDLGFEKDAVKKALIQNKNDWSKTIDALLS